MGIRWRGARGAIVALCLVIAIGCAVGWLAPDTKRRMEAAGPSVQPAAYLPIPILQTGFSQKGYVNGQYWMKVLQPNFETYAGNGLYSSDFQAEVSAYSDTPTIANYGLFFAYGGTTGLYDFQLNPGTGQYALFRQIYVQSTPTPTFTVVTIINWTSSTAILTGSQVNQLKVTRSGTTITLYANGVQLAQVNDSNLEAGNVGMDLSGSAANAEAFYDNFAFVDNTTTPLPFVARSAVNVAQPAVGRGSAVSVPGLAPVGNPADSRVSGSR